jgi:hypothetical protein
VSPALDGAVIAATFPLPRNLLVTPWTFLERVPTPSLDAYRMWADADVRPGTQDQLAQAARWAAMTQAWDQASLRDRIVFCLREVGVAEAIAELRGPSGRGGRR